MSFISTIAADEATDDVRDMYQRQQDHWGYVPNYAKVFSHRPQVLARWAGLLAELKRPMDAREFELITFAAAQALRHSYCSLAHGQALLAFFSEEELAAIIDRKYEGVLTDAEIVMMRFARKVATEAFRVTRGDTEVLKANGFSDDDIFDIAAVAAGRAFFTKLTDALGTEADAAYLDLPTLLRADLAKGRPIDYKPSDRLPEKPSLAAVG